LGVSRHRPCGSGERGLYVKEGNFASGIGKGKIKKEKTKAPRPGWGPQLLLCKKGELPPGKRGNYFGGGKGAAEREKKQESETWRRAGTKSVNVVADDNCRPYLAGLK